MVIDSAGPNGAPYSAAAAPNRSLEGHKLLLLIPEAPPQEYLDRLHTNFPGLEVVYHRLDWRETKTQTLFPEEEWKDITILLASGNALPTKDLAPKLQYVQLMSAGANHVLKNPLFSDTDIAFCTANGVHGPQISEWVITTFLAFQHHIPHYLDLQRQGKWQRSHTIVDDAVGQRVGILGYGSIGRQVARVAKALGSDVHAYTLHPRNTPESRRDESYTPPGLGDPEGVLPSKWFSGDTKEELHSFLSSGLDLLVVSLPLTDKTTHLLSAPEFQILSAKKTFVSNIARGPIVDTADLIEALDTGLIRGAALDVTDPEPLPDGHALWGAKNVIVTPHVSGASTAYNQRVFAILEHNLGRFSEGKGLTNRVSRRDGY
ncbi:D-isomer specific 2-hydroxyacid dehydrogenase [Phialemonium atrogriseum]|uniref:D-isomer specific 2-hydroxyacid dehydrogenase n=1 Tax=Phialemonium atrogriseum TaxID=1093897 RepID=A0AAJ0FJL0_9PEZI|nr:D-isomer specific 2-hydroxyacid dehydrogenase [Phialemonium atrogriseum]KAK1770037.1 D-isomer specific 2-hydroxyacid dehydrogenase [Phialemonium atrogriseum]